MLRGWVAGRLREEQGAVLVLMSATLTVLLGLGALVLDVANARQRQAQVQTGADAAALAGAYELARGGSGGAAELVARGYANDNGVDGTAAEVHVPPASGPRSGDVSCVEVRPAEDVKTTFGRIFGVEKLTVGARAVACARSGGDGYAIFAGSTVCQNTIDWSGSSSKVTGGVHTNRDLHLAGSSNQIHGLVTYLTSVDSGGGGIVFDPATDNPLKISDPLSYPVGFAVADYAPGGSRAGLAVSGGRYHNAGSTAIDMGWLRHRGLWNDTTATLSPGLYYTTKGISLNASKIIGEGVTLVSGGGTVSLSGSSHRLTPWDPEGLLVFSGLQKHSDPLHSGNCVSSGIKLSGSTHSWTGIMFAPGSEIQMSGASNTSIDGSLIGLTVTLHGSQIDLARSQHSPRAPKQAELSE